MGGRGGLIASATHGADVRIVVVAAGAGADMTERRRVHVEILFGRDTDCVAIRTNVGEKRRQPVGWEDGTGEAAGGATGAGAAPSAGAEPVLLFPAQAAPCSGDCGPLA